MEGGVDPGDRRRSAGDPIGRPRHLHRRRLQAGRRQHARGGGGREAVRRHADAGTRAFIAIRGVASDRAQDGSRDQSPELPGDARHVSLLGGNIKAPTQLKRVAPAYPPIALSARVSGIVILETTIGVDGRVIDAKILRSVPLLDQAALDAVRQWEYTPTLLNGAPVPVVMTATVSFSLPAPPDQVQ